MVAEDSFLYHEANMQQKTEDERWYVMRAAGRNAGASMKLRECLDRMRSAGIEIFRPEIEKLVKVNGVARLQVRPAMGDLFFAKADRQRIERFIEMTCGYVQFRYRRGEYHGVMEVPQYQMDNFIAAVRELSVKKYYMPEELQMLPSGTKVRVHAPGTAMHGITGTFTRPKGSRSRCLIVDIPGMLAASFEVLPEYLEVVETLEKR